MAGKNKGRIVQIIGAVIDVRFEDELPALYNAVEIELDGEKIVLEVMQHLMITQCAVFLCTPQKA